MKNRKPFSLPPLLLPSPRSRLLTSRPSISLPSIRAACLLAAALLLVPAAQGAEGVHAKGRSRLAAHSLAQPLPPVMPGMPAPATLMAAMQLAEQHYRQGQDAEALSLLASLVALAPQHRHAAWLRLGNIHQRRGDVGAALDAYRRLRPEGAAQPGPGTAHTAGVPKPGQGAGARGGQVAHAGVRRELQAEDNALRLKAMLNMSMVSLAQGYDALVQIGTLQQQSPQVWQEAGIDEQTARSLLHGLQAQVAEIRQLLGVPATAPLPAARGDSAHALNAARPQPRPAPATARAAARAPQILVSYPGAAARKPRAVPGTGKASTAAPRADAAMSVPAASQSAAGAEARQARTAAAPAEAAPVEAAPAAVAPAVPAPAVALPPPGTTREDGAQGQDKTRSANSESTQGHDTRTAVSTPAVPAVPAAPAALAAQPLVMRPVTPGKPAAPHPAPQQPVSAGQG